MKNQESTNHRTVENLNAKIQRLMAKTRDKVTKLQETELRTKAIKIRMARIRKEIRITSKKLSNKKAKKELNTRSGKRTTLKFRILELWQEESIKRLKR